MRCPDLQELPPPPPGKTGWPWTEASASLPNARPDGIPWPRISIVTPSFNQAQFLEATLRSVLLQGYPDLEYFVLDGKSSDGSVEIIKKYAPWLAYWVSERDGGQSAAINRGLTMSSGLLTTWINSDDMLYRDALVNHASQIGFREGIVYVGDCHIIDERSRLLHVHRARVHNFEDLVRIRAIWRGEPRGYIVQPEVLFPRQLAQDAGGVDVRNHRTMDYDLWGRLLLSGATVQYTQIPFGIFRQHAAQKTHQIWTQTRALIDTAVTLLGQAPHLPEHTREGFIADLYAYRREYWLETGPLARIGLPENVVLRLRDIQASVRRRAANLLRGSREEQRG